MKLNTLNVILGARLGNSGITGWNSAAKSDVGNVRKINEDSFLSLPEFGVWAVADGMGGHECGDVASQTTVECIETAEDLDGATFEQRNEIVVDQVRKANTKLRELAQREGGGQIIGTTVVCLVLSTDKYAIHWVGDSRIYLVRDGEFKQISHDHSHVAELVQRGLISEEEAEQHPMANVLTRAIGAHDNVEVDSLYGDLKQGDKFLLCSDGLTKELSDTEISDIMKAEDPEDTVQACIHSALVREARDNVTAVVVRVN